MVYCRYRVDGYSPAYGDKHREKSGTDKYDSRPDVGNKILGCDTVQQILYVPHRYEGAGYAEKKACRCETISGRAAAEPHTRNAWLRVAVAFTAVGMFLLPGA